MICIHLLDVLRGQNQAYSSFFSTSEFHELFPRISAGPQKQRYKVDHIYFTQGVHRNLFEQTPFK